MNGAGRIRSRRIAWAAALFAALFAALLSLGATAAAAPYISYTYNADGVAVGCPDLYTPERELFSVDYGVGYLSNPTDLFVTEDGSLYILDSGGRRVIHIDRDFNLVAIVDTFLQDGVASPLEKPMGLFVDSEGGLYIADTGNGRIVIADPDGTIRRTIGKPDSELFNATVDFQPTKLVRDSAGNLYVQATGMFQGLILFDRDARFQGFFGSNTVNAGAQTLQDFFWKQFMTKEQRDLMGKAVPPEVRNLSIDGRDFIYTVTNSPLVPLTDRKIAMDAIRRLNPKGNDTTVDKMPEAARTAMEMEARNLNFIDVATDDAGNLLVVDNYMGKILQFDSNRSLIVAFGDFGDYLGAFVSPVAIGTFGDRIFVLDSRRASITVFRPTEFGAQVQEALRLYNAGLYDEALAPWISVLESNVHFELAYVGIGNSLLNQQDYRGAMRYFELGRDDSRYNEAFREYRIQLLRQNALPILVVVLVLAAAVRFGVPAIRRRRARNA